MTVAAKPTPKLQLLQQLSHERQCTEIVRFIWPDDAVECGRDAIGICAYCGTGVCIEHSDSCLEACILHAGCLDGHEKETNHRIRLEGVCGL